MQGPAVVGWLLAGLMGVTGLYCLARLLRLIAQNTREPEERTLDLQAQLAANDLGVRRVAELVELTTMVPTPVPEWSR